VRDDTQMGTEATFDWPERTPISRDI